MNTNATSHDGMVDEHLRRGHAAMASGDVEAAVEHYRVAAEGAPDLASARHNLGAALYRCGLFDGALAELAEAARLAPRSAETFFTSGLIRKDQGEYAEAEALFSRSLELAGRYAQAYYNRGICRFSRGDSEAAASDFARVIEIRPEARDAFHNLITALAVAGLFDEADVVLAETPDMPRQLAADLCAKLGMAYCESSGMQADRAEGYFRRALKADSGHVEAHYRLGLLYARDKHRNPAKRDLALAELEPLLERSDLAAQFPESHRVYFAVGTCYDDLPDELEAAAELYGRCLSVAPEFAPALNNLGVVRQKQGEIRPALELYRRAILADPDYGPAYHNLCAAYYDQRAELVVEDFLQLVHCAESRGDCARIMVRLLPCLADVARADAFATLYDQMHSTKNLLAVIGSCARGLDRRLAAGEPAEATALEARRLAELQTQAYDSVVEFLRVLRPPELQLEVVDLNDTVNRAALYVRMQAEDARIETDLSPTLSRIKGDPRRLREMIVNVIQNAVHAADGGPVTVSTRPTRDPWAPYGRSDAAQVLVADRGTGIPADRLRDVLQPGFTTKSGGSGFGLTIASQIAREHQGELRIDSVEGEGTTVVVELPSVPELQPEAGRLRLRPVIHEDYRTMIQTEAEDEEAADDHRLEMRP